MKNNKSNCNQITNYITKSFWLLVIFLTFTLYYFFYSTDNDSLKFIVKEIQFENTNTTPLFDVKFASSGITQHTHAATAITLDDNKLLAVWYGGTDEGSPDAKLYSAIYDPLENTWKNEKPIVTRENTQQSLNRYIRKIGNPVLAHYNNEIWLFYVTVSYGGWAGSSINLITSKNNGQTWSEAKRLITAPFFNLSTLVKGPPVYYHDGSLGLPVYQEFMGKFAEIIRFDKNAHVLNKQRLSKNRIALQPIVLPYSENTAITLMRYAKRETPRRILQSSTKNTGITWSKPEKITLANPNAAVAGLRLKNGDLLIIFNNKQDGRHDLSLGHSKDNGVSWRTIYTFEQTESEVSSDPTQEKGYIKHEFSYPWVTQSPNGHIHLLYTWYKSHIKHIRFNMAWLEQQL